MASRNTIAEGPVMRGLALDGTEFASGAAGVTGTFQLMTVVRSAWPSKIQTMSPRKLWMKGSALVTLQTANSGLATFAADTWFWIPCGALMWGSTVFPLNIKSTGAINLEYYFEFDD